MGTLHIQFQYWKEVYWISLLSWRHPIEVTTSERFTLWYWLIGDCESNRYVTWLSGDASKWSLDYEKAILQMGTLFAHNLTQRLSCDYSAGIFGVVESQTGRVFAPFKTGDQTTVETESFPSESTLRKAKVGLPANSHSNIFLWNNPHRQPSTGKNSQWWIWC